jgi:SAM-dependent methyltransferase
MKAREPEDHADRVGTSYRGESAEAYFDYQRSIGELGGRLDRRKFEPEIRPTDVVVDFGCGTGAILQQLSARAKIGIEVSEVARRAAAERGLDTVGSAAELDAESVDVVISNHALEHTLRPLDELRGLHRILRRGGKLVLWLPLDDWRVQRSAAPDANHHLYTWTPQLLRNLLVEAGFEVRNCRVVPHAWPPFSERLSNVPRPIFDTLATLWAVLRRRRQLMAVATRP